MLLEGIENVRSPSKILKWKYHFTYFSFKVFCSLKQIFIIDFSNWSCSFSQAVHGNKQNIEKTSRCYSRRKNYLKIFWLLCHIINNFWLKVLYFQWLVQMGNSTLSHICINGVFPMTVKIHYQQWPTWSKQFQTTHTI